MKKVRTVLLLAALMMTLPVGSALADYDVVYYTYSDGTTVEVYVDPDTPHYEYWQASIDAAIRQGILDENGNEIPRTTPELGDGGASLALLSGAAAFSAAGFAFTRRKVRNEK